MQRTWCVVWSLLLIVGASAQANAAPGETQKPERAVEIDAKCWLNAQRVRIEDAPKLILLEFWSVRSRESRDFVEPLTNIYEAYGDGRLLIVALTEDDCKDAQVFIRREKIPYKVGAESRSGKDYGIKEVKDLPGVVLVDPKDARIVGRWSGREVKAKAIAEAIQKLLGPPKGAGIPPGTLPQADMELFHARIEQTNDQLAAITSEILAVDGEVGPQALAALDRFYQENLSEDPNVDSWLTRAQRLARNAIMGADLDVGYGKLISSGRLSEAGKTAIRDRVLEIAERDPGVGVRIGVAHALRKFIGQPGDPVLLEALRRMLERETNAMVRASLDHALDELGQATRKEEPPLSALKLGRMLKQSPDPASSVWADAYAYWQTVSDRTTEQLLEDYRAYPDPPGDEIGRQNATLKRDEALHEIEHRIDRGEVRDLRLVKDHLARVLSEEPDWFIRKSAVWSGLKPIAERGGRALRAEIVELFEKRLPEEPDRYVRAGLEYALQELKPK